MNKFIFTAVLMVSAIGGFAAAQGARGMGGGGISGQPIDGTTIKPKSVQASGTGDQFMCTATTAVCEVESNINAATMTATVPAFDIGPTATPGVNDRLACFSYGPSGSKTRVACVDVEGQLSATSGYFGVSETTNSIRLHALNETTSYTPSNFSSQHSVFGRAGESGASSGGVFLSYHTTDNEGIIGSLTPGTAWRALSVASNGLKVRPAGGSATVTLDNNVNTTGSVLASATINSGIASGSNAYTCTNVGCRLSLGNTTRYIVDNAGSYAIYGAGLTVFNGSFAADTITDANGGPITYRTFASDGASAVGHIFRTNSTWSTAGAKLASFRNNTSEVSFIDYLGNMSGATFTATTATGSAVTGGGASGPLLFTSNTPDSFTSTTAAAIRLQASQDIGNSDLLFTVDDFGGNRRLSVNESGNVTVGNQLTAGGQIESLSQFVSGIGTFTTSLGTGTPATLQSGRTSGNAIQLKVTANLSADTDRTVVVQNNVSTDVAHFSKDGLLRVNASNAAKPTCNATNRGRVFYLDGAAGVADTYEICGKSAADTYAWKAIVTF